MDEPVPITILRIDKDGWRNEQRRLVEERPLRLVVNGRELATLVASPHQLTFLVAGFFRLQGFVTGINDFLSLGVCADKGVASIQLRNDLPVELRPTLTSGCGTGISFNLPDVSSRQPATSGSIAPETVFNLMRQMFQRAERYAAHGGCHSAAVGDDSGLLLHAEDLGRHNTLDRIAGEALFRSIDLSGKLLVTSGRISTEMVAKATRLGLAAIASGTSPTDMAVEMAEAAGIALLGYVRGTSCQVFSQHHLLATPGPAKIPGITGVILAGGESRCMGSDKSLLPFAGARFIERIYHRMAGLFDEVIVVTNSPGLYGDLPCRKVPDLYPEKGSLIGVHAGLKQSCTDKAFIVACDMPFLSAEVIRRLCSQRERSDVVVPCGKQGVEPLHALYDRRCLTAIEEQIEGGEKKIDSFFPRVRVHEVPMTDFADCDPEGLSFRNINTPQEYFALRDAAREELPAPPLFEAGRQQAQ
jgi:FdhD protein